MLISVQQKRRLRQLETDMPKYLLNKLQKWNKKPVHFQLNTEQDSAEFQINSSICWKSNLVQAYHIQHLYSAIRCWISSENFIFCSFCVCLHICSLLNHGNDPNSTWRTWTKWCPWADAPPTPQLLRRAVTHFLPSFTPGSCKTRRKNNQLKAIIKNTWPGTPALIYILVVNSEKCVFSFQCPETCEMSRVLSSERRNPRGRGYGRNGLIVSTLCCKFIVNSQEGKGSKLLQCI